MSRTAPKRRLVVPPEITAVLADPKKAARLRQELQDRLAGMRLDTYQPYAKQQAFHAAGADSRERALLAGNQLGKTFSAAAEAAYHLTGMYPDWWQGRRFAHPTAGWACGVTNEVTRDTVQRLLLGRAENIGTGMIPKARIKGTSAARGIANAVDTAVIHHASGGVSQVQFKSYEAGRAKFQGETLDWVWLDEEPPEDIYSECVTRTNATGGIVFCTFTPLLGMTNVVNQFYPRPTTRDRHLTMMEIEDAGHISPEQRQKIINAYKPHEREARTRGVPMLGSGAIITVPETAWIIEPFTVPRMWPGVIGIDIGGSDHPAGGALLRWDRETDTVYVTNSIASSEVTLAQHAAVIKSFGDYPVAWPHDANSSDRSSGLQIAAIYGRQGLDMMLEHSTHEMGGFGLEASIADMIERMESGRFKVFAHLNGLRQELRMWHRSEGRVVKKADDEIAAVRYAMMMLRFSRPPRGAVGGATGVKRRIRML
jgi:phage terminase large subunit-like protein